MPTGTAPKPMAAKSTAGQSQCKRPTIATRSPGSTPSFSRPYSAMRMARRSSFQSGADSKPSAVGQVMTVGRTWCRSPMS